MGAYSINIKLYGEGKLICIPIALFYCINCPKILFWVLLRHGTFVIFGIGIIKLITILKQRTTILILFFFLFFRFWLNEVHHSGCFLITLNLPKQLGFKPLGKHKRLYMT